MVSLNVWKWLHEDVLRANLGYVYAGEFAWHAAVVSGVPTQVSFISLPSAAV